MSAVQVQIIEDIQARLDYWRRESDASHADVLGCLRLVMLGVEQDFVLRCAQIEDATDEEGGAA
jgi:hypothetical protein